MFKLNKLAKLFNELSLLYFKQLLELSKQFFIFQ